MHARIVRVHDAAAQQLSNATTNQSNHYIRKEAMSHYHKYPMWIFDGDIGRQIHPMQRGDYESAKRDIKPGEHLYMLLREANRWVAVCVDDVEEFTYFYNRYLDGHYLRCLLYSLSEEQHQLAA